MDRQPIVRYILLGLAFVLVFVGVSYLAYRFTRRSGTVVIASPTPVVTTTTTPYQPVAVYPAPVIQPIDTSRRFPSPKPIATFVPVVKSGKAVLVAQDGKGNLLINNLTHEENFGLEQERIQSARTIRLAEIQKELTLRQQELQNLNQRLLSANELSRDQAQYAYALKAQADRLQAELAQIKLQTNIEKQRIGAEVISTALAKIAPISTKPVTYTSYPNYQGNIYPWVNSSY